MQALATTIHVFASVIGSGVTSFERWNREAPALIVAELSGSALVMRRSWSIGSALVEKSNCNRNVVARGLTSLAT